MPLALTYRPKRFQDLVGQPHIVRVLATILKKHYLGQQRLPAGFLFAGSKGTGKTTSARVVAALLNCTAENVGKPGWTMEPCNQCESCKSVIRTNCLFVHEVDAASSGLVDDIRKIKEMATLSHAGLVRVIILDEAHSLTAAAFEALLKQLEEPMPNVLYIFATTEADRFPDTILSRLMQFNFKPLTPELIADRLQLIAAAEGIQVSDSRVFHALALKANGAMRDGITMLEQLSNYKSPLNLADFLDYYGLVGAEISNKLLQMARAGDIVGAKALLQDNFTRSVDFSYFLDSFMLNITDSLHNRSLTSQQAIDAYKATTDVKARLKYMSAFVASNYLFAMLLRVFAFEGAQTAAPMTQEKLTEMFS